MSLQTLANLGEFISAVAVVLSLVYVAYQVRQNTESLRTENYARALDRVATIQARISADPELNRLIARGVLDAGSLSAPERVQFTWTFFEMFGAFEFMHDQAEAGALPEHVWERWAATLSWWISLPGVQSWWRSKPTPFNAKFSVFVEALISAGPSDRAAAARWEEFVRGTVSRPAGAAP